MKKYKRFKSGGKVNPIIVDNPADPRLKSYQDSLQLFNDYQNAAKLIKNGGNYLPNPEVYPYTGNNQSIIAGKRPNPNNPIIQEPAHAFYRVSDIPNSINFHANKNIRPIENERYTRKESFYPSGQDFLDSKASYDDKRAWIGYNLLKYKQPVQPIVYRQQSDMQTITPNGLHQLPIETDNYPPLQQVNIPGGPYPVNIYGLKNGSTNTDLIETQNFNTLQDKQNYIKNRGNLQSISKNTLEDYLDTNTTGKKDQMAMGGTININPANKGKFTATKKKTGKTTEELTHSKNPITRKRAIFAQNAKKWHHMANGGQQFNDFMGNTLGHMGDVALGAIQGADALATQFIYNPQIQKSEMQQLRNTLMPVTSPSNFEGTDMPYYMNGGKITKYDGGGRIRRQHNIVIEDDSDQPFPEAPRTKENIDKLPMYGYVDKSGMLPTVPIPPIKQNKEISFESLKDRDGVPYYAPRFTGPWTQHEVLNAWDNIPNDIQNVPVFRGDAWQNLWETPPNTLATDWKRTDMYAMGGKIPMAKKCADGGKVINQYKTDPDEANVLAEGGEQVQLPNGLTGPITGDKHSDPSGGEYMNLPEGSRVYSDRIKIDKDFASDILNRKIKKAMTVSDLAKKFDTKKEQDIIDSKYSDATAVNTAKMMHAVKTDRLNRIFNYQELVKDPGAFINGNNPALAADGLEIAGQQDQLLLGDNALPLNPWDYQNSPDFTQNTSGNILSPNLGGPSSPMSARPTPMRQVQQTQATTPNNGSFLDKIGKGIGNALGSIGEFAPELAALTNATTKVPISSYKVQPKYLAPTEVNVQGSLNRNYEQTQPALQGGSGNSSTDNARRLQALGNLYDANEQVMQYKYNTDNQNRQQVNQYNNQLENQANMQNIQMALNYQDKATQRKAIQDQSIQNIIQSTYQKSKARRLDRSNLQLANQIYKDWQYVPGTGLVPKGSMPILNTPYGYGNNSIYDNSDGIRTTRTIKGPDGSTIKLQENNRGY